MASSPIYVIDEETKALCGTENYSCSLTSAVLNLLNISHLFPLDLVPFCFTTPASGNHEVLGKAQHPAKLSTKMQQHTGPGPTDTEPVNNRYLPSFGTQTLERLLAVLVWKHQQNFLYCWSSEISIVFAKGNVFKGK